MNYEQKYKDALDAAKHIYDDMKSGGNFGGMEDLEVIFPELAESEDERIRKALIPVVDRLLGTINFPFTEEQVLNWFEKQKEQKPADEQFPPLEGIDAIKAKYYDEGFKNGFDEGVESVKPAEWSEEDEKMRQDLIAYFVGKDVIHNPGLTFYEATEWLKSLPERFNLQPKAEWSKEDELTIADLINYFEGDSLECSAEEMVQRIKSLRPHWKPSKEQMDALEETINQDCVVCNGDRKWIKPNLESLYEQLKKMKALKGVPPIESIQK